MTLTPAEFRTLKTVLTYAAEQIEVAENIIGSVSPRGGAEIGHLVRLKEIKLRIRDERQFIEAQKQAAA